MAEPLVWESDFTTAERSSEASVPELRRAFWQSHESIRELVECFFGRARDRQGREFREYCTRLADEFVNSDRICHNTRFADVRQRRGDFGIPNTSSSPLDYVREMESRVMPDSINVSSPAFIGHMTSALPYFMRDLSNIVVAMNQNTVKLETSKGLSVLERETLGKFHKLVFGMPDDFYAHHTQEPDATLGVVTSGGTIANITSLWCARNTGLPARDGFAGVEEEGLYAALQHYGYKGIAIIGSGMMHYSFEKAAGVLGVGCHGLLKMPVDEQHRVKVNAVREALDRCRENGIFVLAVIGVAGTTESGAIDPLEELAALAREYNVHFHVDAAWGGALLLSRAYASRLRGIELADTVTIDGHKQLYTPLGTGVALFRDSKLARVIEKTARYIIRRGSHDLGRRSLEGSRPANALYLNACVTILGREGLELLLNDNVRKTRYMYERVVSRPEFEPLVDPQMNILVYRYLPEWARDRAAAGTLSPEEQLILNDLNAKIQRAQRNAGIRFVSRTTVETTKYGTGLPILALRVVIANPLTTESHIDAVLDEQLWRAHELEGSEVASAVGA
jgi:putative pyridoxal-dependent aspartate 1-decarboxylase